MKRALSLLFFLLFAQCYAQTTTSYSVDYKTNGLVDMANLSRIKSAGDFNQDNLTDLQIEYKIADIISRSGEAYSIECPFNKNRLTYLNFIAPKDLPEFTSGYFKTSSMTAQKQHVYKYDIFYIAVPEGNAVDALNVYFTIRAINIIKYKYPEAYFKLVQETLTPLYGRYANTAVYNSAFGSNVTLLNSNKYIFIIFNQVPGGTASGITAFNDNSYRWVKNNNVSMYANFPLISIHKTKLLGTTAGLGSDGIYKAPDPESNYYLYMRDGLVETLVHEFIHRLIDVRYTVDPFCSYLFNNRLSNNASLDALEEAIVRYTAAAYFMKAKGVSAKMLQFENVEADLNTVDLLNSGKLTDLLKNINTLKGANETDIRKVLQIPIWDN